LPVEVNIKIPANPSTQPGLLKDVLQEPAGHAEVKDAEGWYHTGDAGFLDSDGHLRIIDRANDVGRLADGTLFPPKYQEQAEFLPVHQGGGRLRESTGAGTASSTSTRPRWQLGRKNAPALRGLPRSRRQAGGRRLDHECVSKKGNATLPTPKARSSQIHRFSDPAQGVGSDDDELTRTRKVAAAFHR